MFLVCGEALWDLFTGEETDGLEIEARIGGSPFNVAVGLARLQQDAALFTGISNDPMGQRLIAALNRESVDTRFIVATDRPSTLSLVDVNSDGIPAYTFYGHKAADRAVRAEDLPTLESDLWGIHAGSYSLVVEPVGSSLLHLFEREAGRRLLSLDPNVRLNVEPDTNLWRNRVDRFAKCADLIKVSYEDLSLIYPDAASDEIARRWLSAGAGIVIVTRGESGAEAFKETERVMVGGYRAELIDTVGAGDTFQAAMIAGMAEMGICSRPALDGMTSEHVVQLMNFAARAAAITCSRRGADLPFRSDLPELGDA
jgi:fructokinase